jgi:hypothetical protein
VKVGWIGVVIAVVVGEKTDVVILPMNIYIVVLIMISMMIFPALIIHRELQNLNSIG